MRHLDGYLSHRAQIEWPGALVYRDLGPPGGWVLERIGQDPLGLGEDFGDAKQAVDALLRAERARRNQR